VIVLDTHALIWWVSGDKRFSRKAKAAVSREHPRGHIHVSAISLWEIAMLAEHGRLTLTMEMDEWLSAVQSIASVSLIPVTPKLALQAVRLPGEFHKDPADRMIVALAREENAVLVTADDKIQRYPHVRCIW
jgi:PIN domain nuclease of toxin-antitoxin system